MLKTQYSKLLSNGVIFIYYIKSKDNLENLLTKGLPRDQVNYLSRGMRLKLMIKNKKKVFKLVTQPSWLEIPRSRFKKTIKLWMIRRSTKEILISLIYSDLFPILIIRLDNGAIWFVPGNSAIWFVPTWCLSWFMSSWCSLIAGVINKSYNLLHHELG